MKKVVIVLALVISILACSCLSAAEPDPLIVKADGGHYYAYSFLVVMTGMSAMMMEKSPSIWKMHVQKLSAEAKALNIILDPDLKKIKDLKTANKASVSYLAQLQTKVNSLELEYRAPMLTYANLGGRVQIVLQSLIIASVRNSPPDEQQMIDDSLTFIIKTIAELKIGDGILNELIANLPKIQKNGNPKDADKALKVYKAWALKFNDEIVRQSIVASQNM